MQSWHEIVILARSQRHFHGLYLVLQGWMDRLFICCLLLLALLQVNQNFQAWCRNCQGLCNADESIIPCGLEVCEFNTSAVSDCISSSGYTASALPGDMDHSFFYLCFLLQWQWQQILQSTVKHAKCIIQLSFNVSWQLLAKQDEMVFLGTSATDHSPKRNPSPCSSFSQGLCSSVWWEKHHIPLLN